MPVKKIILFRFHKDLQVCKSRLEILKHFNPDHEIHGLYGGDHSNFSHFSNGLEGLMRTIGLTKSTDPQWKWLHPDIAIKHWYIEIGKHLDFDYLYDFEWDILALDALDNIYPEIDQNTVALSSLTPMKQVENTWEWTSEDIHVKAYQQFKEYLRSTYAIDEQKYASLGPGPYFPRKFLEKFAKTEDNHMVISEIAYPAIAEGLGFKLINNGIMPEWDDEENETKFFNCNDIEIKREVILEELNKPDGRRIFHPIKTKVTLDDFI